MERQNRSDPRQSPQLLNLLGRQEVTQIDNTDYKFHAYITATKERISTRMLPMMKSLLQKIAPSADEDYITSWQLNRTRSSGVFFTNIEITCNFRKSDPLTLVCGRRNHAGLYSLMSSNFSTCMHHHCQRLSRARGSVTLTKYMSVYRRIYSFTNVRLKRFDCIYMRLRCPLATQENSSGSINARPRVEAPILDNLERDWKRG